MASESKAKVIERNRAPRVQIAYDVEHYGSPTTIELPFVMGVMADLAGKSETKEAMKPVNDRSFVANTWTVTEDISAFYLQADYSWNKFRGNIGFRYVQTESDSLA